MNEKTININVGGMECSIVTDEDRGYILKVAGIVDDKIEEILKSNPRISTTVASLLAAMEFCDMHFKVSESVDNMRSQIKPYIDEASKLRAERDDCIRENERLRREIESLRNQLSNK